MFRPGEIEKALVNRELLYHRRIAAADILERLGAGGVELEIRRRDHQRGTLSQCHADRFACFDIVLFRGDRFCQHNAAPALGASADHGWNQPQVCFAVFDAAGRFPREKRAVDVDVKN